MQANIKKLSVNILRLTICCAAMAFFLVPPRRFFSLDPANCSELMYFGKEFLFVTIVSVTAAFLYAKNRKHCVPGPVVLFKSIKEKCFLAGIFILCFSSMLAINFFFTGNIPDAGDNLSYINQAKIFSSARAYAPAPVSREHFCSLLDVVKDGKWYSRYTPGFPLILGLAILLRFPLYAVSPVFGGLCLVLIYLVGKEMYGRRIAVYAAILGLVSPFFLVFNTAFKSENCSLFFFLLFVFFFVRTTEREAASYPLLSGLFLGGSFIIRPYAALLAGAPFIAYLFFLSLKRDKGIRAKIFLFTVGFLILSWILPWYQWKVTGNPFASTYTVAEGMKYDYPGFHTVFFKFTLSLAWDGIRTNAVLLNRFLFGWPVSFIFIFVWVFFSRKNKWDILLLLSFLAIAVGHFFYWSITFRYWHTAFPFFLFCTAKGVIEVPLLLKKIGISSRTGKNWTMIFILVCFWQSLVALYPSLYKSIRSVFLEESKQIPVMVQKSGIHNAVVFIRPYKPLSTRSWRAAYPRVLDICTAGLSRNSPYLDNDILYAIDFGKDNLKVINYYRDRRFYIYEFNGGRGADKLYEMLYSKE